MRSAKRIRVSQNNGKKSKGPRTAAGKMIARRNAWRHGLSTINRDNPVYAGEIADIAKAIYGRDDHPLLVRQAVIIAECEVLTRYLLVEIARTIDRFRDPAVLSSGHRRQGSHAQAKPSGALLTLKPIEDSEKPAALPDASAYRPTIERDEGEALRAALPYLKRLDRYHRRAWSRRSRAILCFRDTKDYLRAIVSPKTPRQPDTFDPKTGHYVVRLAEPGWPGQIVSNQYLSPEQS
jgi:hypothetical protein